MIAAGEQAIKVGIARDPIARLKKLQTGSFRLLELSATVECNERDCSIVEARAHANLEDRRLKGEWFAATKEEGMLAIRHAIESIDLERSRMARGLFSSRRRNGRVSYGVLRNGRHLVD